MDNFLGKNFPKAAYFDEKLKENRDNNHIKHKKMGLFRAPFLNLIVLN